jgi:hypothetical protein
MKRLLSALLLLVPSCVPRDRVEAPPAYLAPPPRDDRASQLEAEIARLRMWLVAREARIQEVSLGEAALTRQLQDASSLNDEMGERLRLSSHSLEALAAERERLLGALAAAQAKLEEREAEALQSLPQVENDETAPSPELPVSEPGEVASVPEQ